MDYEEESLSRLFEDYLYDNEKILWTGKPMGKNIFSLHDISLLPWTSGSRGKDKFSLLDILYPIRIFPFGVPKLLWVTNFFLLFLLLSLLLIFVEPKDRVGQAIVLFAYLMIIFTLCSSLGEFLYRNWKRRDSYYAIMNERALVLTKDQNRGIKSEWIAEIPKIHKFVHPNGCGTIVFDKDSYSPSSTELYREYYYSRFNPFNIPYLLSLLPKKEPLIFQDIENAEEVFDLIERLRNGNLQGSFR